MQDQDRQNINYIVVKHGATYWSCGSNINSVQPIKQKLVWMSVENRIEFQTYRTSKSR